MRAHSLGKHHSLFPLWLTHQNMTRKANFKVFPAESILGSSILEIPQSCSPPSPISYRFLFEEKKKAILVGAGVVMFRTMRPTGWPSEMH